MNERASELLKMNKATRAMHVKASALRAAKATSIKEFAASTALKTIFYGTAGRLNRRI